MNLNVERRLRALVTSIATKITGPASATSGNIVSFNGTTGTLAQDSGVLASSVVVGPASSTDNAVVRFDSTTGKLVQNSGVIIDDSDNVGVGVTPTMSGAGYNGVHIHGSTTGGQLHLTGGSSGTSASDGTIITHQSADIYINNQENGNIYLYRNATQVAQFDTNNCLSIGTTAASASNYRMDIKSVSGANTYGVIRAASTYAAILSLAGNAKTPGTDAYELFQGGDSNGYIYNRANANIVFGTNNTQVAQFDSSGNLSIGTTGTGPRLYVVKSDNTNYLTDFANSFGSGNGYINRMQFSGSAPNNGTSIFSAMVDTGGSRCIIYSNGGIANYQANDSNLSDRNEKKDFEPSRSYLDAICKIPVQTFRYIDQTDDEKTLGVVAQDVQAVAPELVMESNWGTEEEPKMRLSVYQTDLQYALMKSIQELKERLDAATEEIRIIKGLQK